MPQRFLRDWRVVLRVSARCGGEKLELAYKVLGRVGVGAVR